MKQTKCEWWLSMFNESHAGLRADSHKAEPNGFANTYVKEAAEKKGGR